MQELLPIALGASVAFACSQVASARLRCSLFVVLMLLAAVLASLVNGEQPGWPLFIAADLCFALAGAVCARMCLTGLSRVTQQWLARSDVAGRVGRT